MSSFLYQKHSEYAHQSLGSDFSDSLVKFHFWYTLKDHNCLKVTEYKINIYNFLTVHLIGGNVYTK